MTCPNLVLYTFMNRSVFVLETSIGRREEEGWSEVGEKEEAERNILEKDMKNSNQSDKKETELALV